MLGKIALHHYALHLTVVPVRVSDGYYVLGTEDADGIVSRESVEHWETRAQAGSALKLGTWTQRVPENAFGKLAEKLGYHLEVQVLKSGAGYYLGTWDDGPCSRESQEYWASEAEAQEALESGTWTQRNNP